MKFVICIAEKNIEIQCMYSDIYEMCRNYLTESTYIDLHVATSDADIQYERERSTEQNMIEGIPVQNYSPGYLETLAVYRKIASELLHSDILLMHGSVVAVGDRAVIFTGPSGIGKTTHSRLWIKNVPDSYILNGDKPLICVKDHEMVAYGTPWAGKENISVNGQAKLCAIVFMEQGTRNQIREVEPMSEFGNLMRQIFIPEGASDIQKILELSGKMCENIPFFRLCCNMEPEAANVSWSTLRKVLEDTV